MGNKLDTPYSARSLEEKIESNWAKTIGLMKRGEFSTVVIRAATTVELASNLLIFYEFQQRRGLPAYFVEKLMIRANGLKGKVEFLLHPIYKNTNFENDLEEIKKRSKDINDERNSIVHKGQFKIKKTAQKILEEAEFIVNKFAELSASDLRVSSEISEEEDDA